MHLFLFPSLLYLTLLSSTVVSVIRKWPSTSSSVLLALPETRAAP
jgi:hypothetical protein